MVGMGYNCWALKHFPNSKFHVSMGLQFKLLRGPRYRHWVQKIMIMIMIP